MSTFTLSFDPQKLDGSLWRGKFKITPTDTITNAEHGGVIIKDETEIYQYVQGQTVSIQLPAVGSNTRPQEFGYYVTYGPYMRPVYVPAQVAGASVSLLTFIRQPVEPPATAAVSVQPDGTLNSRGAAAVEAMITAALDAYDGGGSGSDLTTTFVQQTPAAQWQLTSPMNRYPVVTIYVNGEEVIADVRVAVGAATVTFAEPTAGVAIIQ